MVYFNALFQNLTGGTEYNQQNVSKLGMCPGDSNWAVTEDTSKR